MQDQPALWARLCGDGSPTVVFEAGGGENASVWDELEADVRERHRVRTMVYDRAGLGRSPPRSSAYSIDGEAEALRLELDRHSVDAPIVLVAHSYGAFIATLLAGTDPRIAGLVLVDGNLASFFDEEQLERLLATYAPQFAALEQAAPDLARVMIPVIQAYPATVERLRAVDVPADLPVVDIVAERTWVELPGEIEAIRRAHSDFVAASPQRRAVFADKSGHHVMRDRPDLVLEAIGSVIAAVRA